jgi:hypothetical protein
MALKKNYFFYLTKKIHHLTIILVQSETFFLSLSLSILHVPQHRLSAYKPCSGNRLILICGLCGLDKFSQLTLSRKPFKLMASAGSFGSVLLSIAVDFFNNICVAQARERENENEQNERMHRQSFFLQHEWEKAHASRVKTTRAWLPYQNIRRHRLTCSGSS